MLYYAHEKVLENQLRLIVQGKRRPNSVRAWQIGSSLHSLGRVGWSGLAMLLVAGWYGDFVGTSCVHAFYATEDEFPTFAKLIKDLPYMFTCIYLKNRVLAQVEAMGLIPSFRNRREAEMEEECSWFEARQARQAWPPDIIDRESLETSYARWNEIKADPQYAASPLLVKTRALDTTNDAAEIRQNDGLAFVAGVLTGPQEAIYGLFSPPRAATWE